MKNSKYEGRINPTDKSWENDPWLDLLVERYTLASDFCINRNVLDTCCGTGWGTINFIAPIAKQVIGFDLDPAFTKEYYDKSRCSFHTMDATKISLNADDFDIILALDSIEHMAFSDGLKYLGGVKSVLAENGIFFGTTPLVENDYLKPIFLDWNKYHICMYAEDDLKKILITQFKYTNIYKIYNQVCPYFVFVCSDHSEKLSAIDIRIKEFITHNEKNFSLGKRTAYRLWAKHLLKRGRVIKATNYLIRSFEMQQREK